jgi:hypothetical protein
LNNKSTASSRGGMAAPCAAVDSFRAALRKAKGLLEFSFPGGAAHATVAAGDLIQTALSALLVHVWAAYETFLHDMLKEAWRLLCIEKVRLWRLRTGDVGVPTAEALRTDWPSIMHLCRRALFEKLSQSKRLDPSLASASDLDSIVGSG